MGSSISDFGHLGHTFSFSNLISCLKKTKMSVEELEATIKKKWNKIDGDDGVEDGTLKVDHLQTALDIVGYSLPKHKFKTLVADFRGKFVNEGINQALFIEICTSLHKGDVVRRSRKASIAKEGSGGTSKHTVSNFEQRAYVQWLNELFETDKDVSHLLPIKQEGNDLYEKIGDGIMLCKLVNWVTPDTIDIRAIHLGKKITIFQKHENLNVAISSAKAIGLHVMNIDSHSLLKGNKVLTLGLLWQLIISWLFTFINGFKKHKGIEILFPPPETIVGKKPKEILIRWVNYQLEKAGESKRITNFHTDIKDSVAYTHLIKQIAPEDASVDKSALQKDDLKERAEQTLVQAKKIKCNDFVIAQDIVDGRKLLNLAFVANLFAKYPALIVPPKPDEPVVEVPEPPIMETREEKTYRNWMNSLGLSKKVYWLYEDTNDGLIYLEIFDIIQPGIVDWSKVTKKKQFSNLFAKSEMQKLENCNYVEEVAKKYKLDMVGSQGDDIRKGNKTLVLGLVWQMMKAYTLNLLKKLNKNGTPIAKKDILAWQEKKMTKAGKTPIKSFQDPANKGSLPVIDLINIIKPGSIDFTHVHTGDNLSVEECMDNAKYAFTVARRLKAPIYALPEDMTELNRKMILTVYASLMLANMM